MTPCLINCLIKLNGANKLLGKLAVSSDTDNNNRSIEAVSSRDQHSLNEFALMFEIETEISEKMSRKVKHRVEDLEKTVEEMKIQV